MKTKLVLATLAASLSLVGCGGGSGGASPPVTVPVQVPVPVPTPDLNPLQVTVAASSYTAGSPEHAAFTALNTARTAYGVGQVAENTKLTSAAASHARYITTQFIAGDYYAATHTQNPANPGFTGVTAADRIAFATYAAASSSENLSSIIAVDGIASAPGAVSVDVLLSAPYHRFAFFDGSRDIGFGSASTRMAGEGGIRYTVVANFAVAQSAQPQLPADSWIGVWPTDQATDVMYSLSNETPNPIPINNGACAGYPVSLQVRPNLTLSVTSFTLIETVSGTAINAQLATPTIDANPTYARPNTAYIIPFKPLKLNTKYTARFVGARSGVAVDKTWSFTTTSRNTKMIYGCEPG